MSTLNPRSWVRRLFPTSRRLLVEADVRRYCRQVSGAVLAVGSGHDPYRGLLRHAESYIALDIVAFPGVTDVVGDATALPFRRECFDCVLAIEVMEHVNDPARLVNSAHDVLKVGGSLLLTVPFMYHQHADPGDYWRPTMPALERMFSRFAQVNISPQGNRLNAISDLVTTSFHPASLLAPLRIVNHLIAWPIFVKLIGKSTAPSGYLVSAIK